MTLTQCYLSVDQYSLPKPQDILATLAGEGGGKKLTTLNLSQAYLPLRLDEESQKLVVINTHQEQGKGCINLRDHLLE